MQQGWGVDVDLLLDNFALLRMLASHVIVDRDAAATVCDDLKSKCLAASEQGITRVRVGFDAEARSVSVTPENLS